MKQRKPQHFTPEDYQRLARNPFVDKKMLQFVKNKTVAPSSGAAVPVRSAGTAAGISRQPSTGSQPVMNEKTAQLIAMAIKGMLRE